MGTIKAELIGGEELRRRLRQLNPKINHAILRDALLDAATRIVVNAKDEQIHFASTKGAPPLPDKLTHRSRTLSRSLEPNHAIDERLLPYAIEAGTDKVYGAVHEFGGGRGGSTPARPFLQPALDAIRPKLEGIVAFYWARHGGLT